MTKGMELYELISDQIGQAICLVDSDSIKDLKVQIDINKKKETVSVTSSFQLKEEK